MRDFEDTTLWRLSAFERMRNETGGSGFVRLEGPTMLPSTLLADLGRLERTHDECDALEVIAACVRHREPALLCLRHDEFVWPVSIFPNEMLYHSPRDMSQASASGMASLQVLAVEPPGVKPPGHWKYERVGEAAHYRPLEPLLWAMSLNGPRKQPLSEIGGTAAYRAAVRQERPPVTGAMGSAVEKLRRESVSLREIASWPGMNVERAARLLNGLYLTSDLIVTRSHPAARSEPGLLRGLFGGKSKR
ncbi:MAG TPA: hypothetical protein VFR90_01330 [Methylibium sp.]|uniref:hypothetical protein n=1 Tax=Methylibium sp. TaxID=2067992 RepID=UPI002DB88104|nr:hypothetical protein [Methylibium sp.]HEU4457749.1 hypothetical protein [Methylibium sp.]